MNAHRRKFLVLFVLAGGALFAQDARDLVRKSVERDQVNWARMKDYTWIATVFERRIDDDGSVKSEDKKRWETVVLYGRPFRRMLERHGKPLTADEQRKEQERLDKLAAKFENESPAQRQRRLADYDKKREKERDFLREIPDAYNFRLLGNEQIAGHDTWVIEATPNSSYKPKSSDAKWFSKIRGKFWIDTAAYEWVRLEAETTDTISFGLFLARIAPGAKLVFEQTRVNDEVWLPKRQIVRGSARLGLVKKMSVEQEVDWSSFRKFSTESKIVAVEEH